MPPFGEDGLIQSFCNNRNNEIKTADNFPWIKCSDKLPDMIYDNGTGITYSKNVLIAFNANNPHIRIGHIYNDEWVTINDIPYDCKVDYWAPLPKPPTD